MVALTVSPGDELHPVRRAIKLATGRDIHPSTAWRWVRKGVGGHKLPIVMMAGRPQTTTNAVVEFLAAQTEAAVGLAAEAELEAAGA